MIKRFITILAAIAVLAGSSFAQESKDRIKFNEDADFSIRNGAFSAELLSYLAFGDHYVMNAASGFNNAERNSTETVINLIELRLHPYETGMFAIGVDFDWDYYRLDKSSFWMPDSEKMRVSVASRDENGFKKIKKSNLVVRTLSVPVSLEQSFGKCSLRLGAAVEYNFPGITKFKAIDNNGAKIKETRDGARYADEIKTNQITFNAFAALSYGGLGFYVKYNPKEQFVEGYGPRFTSITAGVICGLGM
ncbi:MAG: hypothetical protein II632_03095 [Bacteroidales bacterium]|nr:hypothetical protein [Bacteroidales bacterium]MBQ3977814.1 hypothetical protein [Bacteroidales bacterium]